MMPHDLPPWYIVYQQTQRWLAAGCFEAMVEDLRQLLRSVKGRKGQPSAAIFESRTLQSTPERSHRNCQAPAFANLPAEGVCCATGASGTAHTFSGSYISPV